MQRLATYAVRHVHAVAGTVAVVMLVSAAVSVPAIFALHEPLSDLILWPAISSFVVSGWLLAVRLPRNAVGWLLLMTGAGLSFLPWSVLSSWMIVHDIGLGRWTAGLSNASFVLDVGGLALLLPLLFPDGRLPSSRRWWRLVLWCDVGYMCIASFNIFEPGALDLPALDQKVLNPFGVTAFDSWLRAFIAICVPMLLVGFAGSFASLVVRWRSADPALRAQMKWVVLALVVAPLPFILHDYALAASDTMMTFILPLVPIAVAVSVLRYRLYDIDRIVSRAVAYLLVTGLLVGVYVGCIALTDAVLPVGSSFGVAASTLAAAALFQPVRRRVQATVDRRFNRSRFDAARTIDAFAVRLRDAVDPDVVRSDLIAVTARAIEPATLSLWVAP
ncbi:MAG TPA: hypothetical protein VFJ98_01005 [Mycobacteriales bacterium]|nr:hypothetical protein [Mycobacteriales bacterium]